MAQQWLSASELPGAGQGIYDESGFVSTDPYGSLRAGMSRPESWERVARQLGYTGPILEVVGVDSEGGAQTDYGPQFRNFIGQKQAEGYEFVVDASTASKQKPTVGLRGPNGQIISEQRWDSGGFGDFLKEFVLPSVGAYFGAGALGNALSPVTNALTGAGAAGGGAGAAMGAGIAEGMAPGVLAPASAAELGAVNALTGAAALPSVPQVPSAPSQLPASAGIAEGMAPGAISPASAAEAAAAASVAANVAGSSGPTGIDLLDKAINFVSTPAGAAIVTGAGNIVGGIAAGEAAKEAAQTQAASADEALQLQRDIYNKFMEMNKPYYEAGVNALGQITRGEITAEPGYGFRLGEGMKALERLQASRGNLLSGGALKAGQRFAQDLASEEYGKSFNRLASIAGIGQTAASQAGAAGQNYAGQAGELGMQGANALVSGRIGRTSAYTSGMQGAIGALQGYQNQQQSNQLMRDLIARLPKP